MRSHSDMSRTKYNVTQSRWGTSSSAPLQPWGRVLVALGAQTHRTVYSFVEKSRETYLGSVVEIVQNITKYHEVILGEKEEKGKVPCAGQAGPET